MKSEVNKCLSRTRCKNREIKTKRSENSFSLTSQPGTLLCLEFPTALFKQVSGETRNYFIFYLLLKAEVPGSGWISNYCFQAPWLSKKFGISENEFIFYLQEIVKLKVVFLEGNKIRIIGWKQLGRLFDIDTQKRTKVHFLCGQDKLSLWFQKNINFES